jgi:hypothetical protein
MDVGSADWCAGETRTVAVTLKNIGQATWTDGSPDINIGVKWDADPDYYIPWRVNAGGLAPGSTQTYYLTVTAPFTTGTDHLTFDVVYEAVCWFGNNNSSCGPGNTVYTSSDLTIQAAPASAPVSSGASICFGTTTSLTASGAGAGEGYKWYSLASGGSLLKTAPVWSTPSLNSTTSYYVCRYNTTSLCESDRTAVTVTVYPPPVATISGTKNISCNAGSDGTITVDASGGSGSGYEFSRDNGDTWTSGASSPHVFTGLSAGSEYKIRVKDGNGCLSPKLQ